MNNNNIPISSNVAALPVPIHHNNPTPPPSTVLPPSATTIPPSNPPQSQPYNNTSTTTATTSHSHSSSSAQSISHTLLYLSSAQKAMQVIIMARKFFVSLINFLFILMSIPLFYPY